MTNTLSSFISLCAVNKFSDNQCHFMNKTGARAIYAAPVYCASSVLWNYSLCGVAGLLTESNRSCGESVATPFP